MRLFENIERRFVGLKCGEMPRFFSFVKWVQNPISGTAKERIISAPNRAMRAVHKVIIASLESYRFGDHVTAYIKGSSARKNAGAHLGGRFFYLLDISSAFGSVSGERLAAILSRLFPESWGSVIETSILLQRYCLDERGGLLTGGQASPLLFNIYASEVIDPGLIAIAERMGVTYTRYGDDIAFSGEDPFGCKKRRRIRGVILAEGFRVSDGKARVCDVSRGSVTITGALITSDGRITVPRKYLSRVEAMLYLAGKYKVPMTRLEGVFGAAMAYLPSSGMTRREARLYYGIRTLRFNRKRERRLI